MMLKFVLINTSLRCYGYSFTTTSRARRQLLILWVSFSVFGPLLAVTLINPKD